MKVQLQPGSLRVRLDEVELAALLAREPLRLRTAVGEAPLFALRVVLAPAFALEREADGGWCLALPNDAVATYVATLPRRDALAFEAGVGASRLRVDFEVDARDSRRVRGHRPRDAIEPG